MNRSPNFIKIAFALLVGAIVFTIAGTEAMASHFRYGTLSWRPTGTLNQVEFRFKISRHNQPGLYHHVLQRRR